MRVLVVDDDDGVRSFAGRVLRMGGYEVREAEDGASALDMTAKSDPFDLAVIDLMMPGMSGDELARRLRERDPNLKVLYFTGYADRLFAEKQHLWEGEAFLDKPVTVKGLQEAVSLLLFGRIQDSSPRST